MKKQAWSPRSNPPSALNVIVRDAKRRLKTHKELVIDLSEEGAYAEDYEDREEAKEAAAHYRGALAPLEGVISAIKRGMSLEEFPAWLAYEILSRIDGMWRTASHAGNYTGPRNDWVGSIVRSGVLHSFYGKASYYALASLVGGIWELLELNKKYTLGLDPAMAEAAKEYKLSRD